MDANFHKMYSADVEFLGKNKTICVSLNGAKNVCDMPDEKIKIFIQTRAQAEALIVAGEQACDLLDDAEDLQKEAV